MRGRYHDAVGSLLGSQAAHLKGYQAGPARKVTGRRRGMTYTEEDWVDDEATSHRRLEE